MSTNQDQTPPHQDSTTNQGHDSDSTKSRDVNTEKQKQQQKESKDSRGPYKKTESNCIEIMTSVVSEMKLMRITHRRHSSYTPNAHCLALILQEMDRIMCSNRYWSAHLGEWNPIISRIYHTILFYLQVFRAKKSVNNLHPETQLFIDQFERQVSFAALPVPGPLVPFYQALAATNCDDPTLGPISPDVPDQVPVANLKAQAFNDDYEGILPNLWLLLRGEERLRTPILHPAQPGVGGQQAQPARIEYECWDYNLDDGTIGPNQSQRPGQTQAGHAGYGIRKAPMGLKRDFSSPRTRKAYADSPMHLRLPTIPAAFPAPTSWYHYILPNDECTFGWISELASLMSLYADHWIGSTTLDKIAPFDSRFACVVAFQDPAIPYANLHVTRANDYIPDMTSSLVSFEPDEIPIPTLKIAAISLPNMVFADNYGSNNIAAALANTRQGPYWDRYNQERSKSVIPSNPMDGLPAMIGSLHKTRSENRT